MSEDFEDIGPIMGMMLVVMMLALFTQAAGGEEEEETANLSGHITDSSSDPVGGVQLSLNGSDYITTGVNGYYEFMMVETGPSILEVINAEALGYEYKPPISLNLVAGGNIRNIVLIAPVTVKANVVGTVKNGVTMEVIAGAAISLNSHNATTNVYGEFGYSNVDPDTYTLTVSKDGFETVSGSVTLVAGDNTLNILLVPEDTPAAEFKVSDLSILPAVMDVGETVEISALVENVGDLVGTYTVNCDITPTTFVPLVAVAVAEIPWSDIFDLTMNMVVIMVFMAMSVKMVSKV